MAEPKHTFLDMTILSSIGGRAAAAALTPEQRKEKARKAVNARWKKSTPQERAEQGQILLAGRRRKAAKAA